MPGRGSSASTSTWVGETTRTRAEVGGSLAGAEPTLASGASRITSRRGSKLGESRRSSAACSLGATLAP